MFFMSCVCHAFASVHCCPMVTCLERADLLALVCVFVTFPCGTLGQVWYLIESIHDLCHLSNFAYSVHPWADPEGDRGSGQPISGKSQAATMFPQKYWYGPL